MKVGATVYYGKLTCTVHGYTPRGLLKIWNGWRLLFVRPELVKQRKMKRRLV